MIFISFRLPSPNLGHTVFTAVRPGFAGGYAILFATKKYTNSSRTDIITKAYMLNKHNDYDLQLE